MPALLITNLSALLSTVECETRLGAECGIINCNFSCDILVVRLENVIFVLFESGMIINDLNKLYIVISFFSQIKNRC